MSLNKPPKHLSRHAPASYQNQSNGANHNEYVGISSETQQTKLIESIGAEVPEATPERRDGILLPATPASETFDLSRGRGNAESNMPTHAEIEGLAYEIYKDDGSPEGCADAHWFEAESFLRRDVVR